MCGIVGFLDTKRMAGPSEAADLVRRMALALAHRGPDGDGVWVDTECGVAFGHRRLAIIDTTATGSQPMASSDGRWIISFNGEIYNYLETRRRLSDKVPGRQWRGSSDTEVLAEATSDLGFEGMLKQTNGMFALAVWDRRDRVLYLARDRMGEKPVYYGWQGSTFLFGSELKALVVHPNFERRIEPSALSLYVAHGYVPHPLSIYRGIWQLEPGHYVKIRADDLPGTKPEKRPYWVLPRPAPEAMDEVQAIETLNSLLRDAVKLRMRADVPMGAFLSGGIDSSTVVGMMQAQSSDPVRSYSIGFEDDVYDESRYAREVARHIGTVHTDIHVTAQDALNVVPMLPAMFDEPFADSSQIPTYLLSKLTRQHVTVSLSGDGGDELFGGYGRYFEFERRSAGRNSVINMVKVPFAAALLSLPMDAMPVVCWAASLARGHAIGPVKVRQAAISLAIKGKHGLYLYMMQLWPDAMMRRPPLPAEPTFLYRENLDRATDPFLGMTYLDMGSYLPDDILVKVDRASMAVSLESRVPMLDHRVVEFSSRIPVALKRRGTTGKWLLRRVLDRYVPSDLVDRPKQGFGIPIKEWMRGPLKEWCAELLNDNSTIIGSLIDLPTARMAWREHQEEGDDHSYRLWVIIMLLAWARTWRPI